MSVIESGLGAEIVIESTGEVTGAPAIVFGGQSSVTAGTLTNNGTIGPSPEHTAGGGIDVDLPSSNNYTEITNNGLIKAQGVVNGRGIDAVLLSGGELTSLTNTGTITAINAGHAIYVDDKYASLDELTNSEGATISTTFDSSVGSGSAASAIKIRSGVDTLINEGTISGASSGIEVVDFDILHRGSIDLLVNLGTIESEQFDVYVKEGNGIGTFVNAQSGLTYRGPLPEFYAVRIDSPQAFGSIDVTSPSGITTFQVDEFSRMTNNTLYPAVLSGVPAENLQTFGGLIGGTFNDLEWSLVPNEEVADQWDLCVGDCTASALPVPVAGPWSLTLLAMFSGLLGLSALRRRRLS